MIQKGDQVSFQKNGKTITGTINFVQFDNVDKDGRTSLYVDVGRKGFTLNYILLEDNIDITRYAARPG